MKIFHAKATISDEASTYRICEPNARDGIICVIIGKNLQVFDSWNDQRCALIDARRFLVGIQIILYIVNLCAVFMGWNLYEFYKCFLSVGCRLFRDFTVLFESNVIQMDCFLGRGP